MQRKVADESFFLLWEVIARLDMPDLESIPDAKAYTVSDGEADTNIHWFIPGTEISIVRIGQGPSAGKYLFSQDTVERVRDFYQISRDLPYLRPMPISNAYRIHQSVTGWMIPMSWVEALPEWVNFELAGQLLWKWIALLALTGLALAMVIAVFLWQQRCSRATFTLSYLCSLSTPLALLILANVLWLFALHQLNVTGAAAELPGYLQKMTHAIAAVWIILLTMHWITESIIASPGIITKSLNASLIRLSVRFIGIIVVFVFLFRVLHELGVPVYGLVAGAGVGGLAVALAARSTLENFMGTLNLFADRPVRVGDFCRYGEDIAPGLPRLGTVEEIGLRSTRIRGKDRTITSIPNAAFSDMHIINLSMRDKMLFRTIIPLRYETTSDQMRLVLLQLREMLLAHPRVAEDPARVRATGFGEFSLNLEIFAYIMTSDWNDFLAVQEDLVLRIMDIVSKAGTAFAIPSQTVYHSRDAGLD
ncbi:MAG: mechanosensitive ion channel domain-containing protein, partial [Gammaproteobacteria bacterium]